MHTDKTDGQFRKRVTFRAADDDRQIATGVVMVPSKVDLQGDYAREDTIQGFAEGFMSRLADGGAGGGIMHAAFPGHSTLVENSVLESSREIGGETVPAGAWTQAWKFDDAELWTLVRDGILSGYSIGAESVEWSDSMGQDDLPEDVTVAADYPDDEPVWELTEGTIKEVSAVDIPAVPDAEILQTKSEDAADKRVAEYLGDREGFLEEMADRGHSDGEAERLWTYLQRAVEEQDADAEREAGWLARAKAFFSDGPGARASASTSKSSATGKESRTLSTANRERLMAAHDAVEDALASDVEFQTNRFTDNLAVDFDVSDYGKAAPTPDGGDADGDADTPDTKSKPMTNDTLDDAPEWAKAIVEQTEANAERIEELADGGSDGGADKDADGDGAESLDDAPEWAKTLASQTEQNAEKIDAVAKAAGTSQQLDGGSDAAETSAKADLLGLPGGGE